MSALFVVVTIGIFSIISLIIRAIAIKDFHKRAFSNYKEKQKAKKTLYYIPLLGPLLYLLKIRKKSPNE